MNTNSIMPIVKKYGWQLGSTLVGLVMMGGGLLSLQSQTQGDTVTIVDPSPILGVISEDKPNVVTIIIDVEGAVLKPGVHSLPSGSRISDALIMAGGLASSADRSWVARFINQAEIVRDGMKIYIPIMGEKTEQLSTDLVMQSNHDGKVSINTASERELDSLWGIGEARARAIIDNRPYASLDELSNKAKIPQDVIEKNMDKLAL